MSRKQDNPQEISSTRRRILDSAREEFHKKGYYGARMQEIADAAGINKAMLHYYYSSKDKLFEAVFREAAFKLIPQIIELFNNDKPFFKKIEFFVENYIDLLNVNSFMPGFILTELNQHPERITGIFREMTTSLPEKIIHEFTKAMADGIINYVDPRQVIVNMISMCIFPFAAKPIIKELLNFTEESYAEFLEFRKKEVSKFIINSIKK